MISFTAAEVDAFAGGLFWPFVRFLALLGAAPVVDNRAVPATLKVALALALAVVVAPTVPEGARAGLAAPGWPAVLAQQLMVGFAIGFALRIVFAAVEVAGDLIGLQMGLSFAGFIDPASQDQSALVGGFLALLATLVFLAIDGHLMLVAALADSFTIVPIAPDAHAVPTARRMLQWGGELFRIGLQLSLPVVATLLVVNLAFGVLARVSPQLNVFAVGFPATLLVGFAALAASLPYLAAPLQRAMEAAVMVLR